MPFYCRVITYWKDHQTRSHNILQNAHVTVVRSTAINVSGGCWGGRIWRRHNFPNPYTDCFILAARFKACFLSASMISHSHEFGTCEVFCGLFSRNGLVYCIHRQTQISQSTIVRACFVVGSGVFWGQWGLR